MGGYEVVVVGALAGIGKSWRGVADEVDVWVYAF